MKEENVKFAVIGCGNIGKRHAAVCDFDERSELIAVCDIDEAKGKEIAGLYNVPYYNDYDQLLAEVDFDVISICTPHGLHANMSIKAAQSKKNILVEKPMALSSEDCNKMIKAADDNGVDLMVVKQNRFNIPISLVRETIEKKALGQIYMVDCRVLWNRHEGYYKNSNWRGDKELEGGALYTQVSHFIDLMIWWFGDVVDAKTSLKTQLHNIEIEDCGQTLVEFDSGVMGNITWSTALYNKNYEGSITIIGEKGTIKIGGQYLNKIDYWDVQSYPLPDIDFSDKPNEYGKYQGTSSNHDKVINNVVSKLLKERHHVVEGDEGIKSIEAIELIYKKA
jgi:predicted dehydrogenase